MMNFDLFGFDFFRRERLIGLWFCSTGINNHGRSLFLCYYADGEWLIDVLWVRVIGRGF